MAFILDSSGNSPTGIPDNRLGSVNRTVTQDPAGAVTPLFSGELVQDIVNNLTYRARGTANTSWIVETLVE